MDAPPAPPALMRMPARWLEHKPHKYPPPTLDVRVVRRRGTEPMTVLAAFPCWVQLGMGVWTRTRRRVVVGTAAAAVVCAAYLVAWGFGRSAASPRVRDRLDDLAVHAGIVAYVGACAAVVWLLLPARGRPVLRVRGGMVSGGAVHGRGPWPAWSVPRGECAALQMLVGEVQLGIFGQTAVTQLVLVFRAGGAPRRRLVLTSAFGWDAARVEALRAFADTIGLPVEFWRIRGWRTPPSYLFIEAPAGAAWVDEPLGEGRAGLGFEDFDAVAERADPPRAEPACRRCGYALAGIADPQACPECGVDFTLHPRARTR